MIKNPFTENTYGAAVIENQIKNPINDKTLIDDAQDARRRWESELIANRDATIERTIKDPKFLNKDFYIVILFKKEKMVQQPRSWILARQSCPTPTYYQTVYKYHRSVGSLEFLWALPDELKYYWLHHNAFSLPKEYHESVKFVHLMESGELLKWVIKENGNKPDGVIKDDKCKPYVVPDKPKGESPCLILQP